MYCTNRQKNQPTRLGIDSIDKGQKQESPAVSAFTQLVPFGLIEFCKQLKVAIEILSMVV